MANIDSIRSLAENIQCGLFASRDSVNEAYEYAVSVAEACGDGKVAVYTAIHVLMNAIGEELERQLNDEDGAC